MWACLHTKCCTASYILAHSKAFPPWNLRLCFSKMMSCFSSPLCSLRLQDFFFFFWVSLTWISRPSFWAQGLITNKNLERWQENWSKGPFLVLSINETVVQMGKRDGINYCITNHIIGMQLKLGNIDTQATRKPFEIKTKNKLFCICVL